MDALESKIIEILKCGTPLRAKDKDIAARLGVERREVNHYLYSSLKPKVIQDSDYKWSLKPQQIRNNQHHPVQPPTPQTQPSRPVSQSNSYKVNNQHRPVQPPTPQTQSSKPVRQNNPYEFIRSELEQVSSEEKVKILENAFRQEQFTALEDEQISALSSILEQAKREVSIANHGYKEGKLSSKKNNPLVIDLSEI